VEGVLKVKVYSRDGRRYENRRWVTASTPAQKTVKQKTPCLVRNTTLKGTPLTSKDSVFARQAAKI
jgi:hypothetical protein